MQLDVDEGYGVTDALEYENCDYFDKRMKLQNYCESELMKQREEHQQQYGRKNWPNFANEDEIFPRRERGEGTPAPR